MQSGAVTTDQVKQLHKTITLLEQTGQLSSWFAFFFKAESLQKVLETLPPQDERAIDTLMTLQKSIHNIQQTLSAFSDPGSFKAAWSRLQELEKLLADKSGPTSADSLNNASPLTRLMMLNTMNQAVDLFDLAIKQMKASPAWSQANKVPLFKEMLGPYFHLLQHWGLQFGPSIDMPVTSKWRIHRYLNQMGELFDGFTTNDINLLKASSGFSVAAAVFGSATEFSRHFPQTLEDFFTLTHQNLLAITSKLRERALDPEIIHQSALPETLKQYIGIIKPDTRKTVLERVIKTGTEVSSDEVTVKYNIPLRSHSAQMDLKYKKQNNRIVLQAHLFGASQDGFHGDRWNSLAFMANLLDREKVLLLSQSIEVSTQKISFTWSVDDKETLQLILDEFAHLCVESLDEHFYVSSQEALSRMIERRGLNVEHLAVLAASGVLDRNPSIRRNSLELYRLFIRQGKFIDETSDVAAKGIENIDQSIRRNFIELFKFLVEKGT